MAQLYCLAALVATLMTVGAASSVGQCGVVSGAQRCNETTCFYSETESGCDGTVHVSVPVCDRVFWSWVDVTFGGGLFQLFESPERAESGYITAEEALAWERTVREGILVNCTVSNSTAFVYGADASTTSGSTVDNHDHDDVTEKPLFWVPVIVIVSCFCALAAAITAIIGAVVFVAKRTKADTF